MEASLVLAGAVTGLLIGLTGMGGGALMTPFLIAVAGVRPVYAVGTDLVYAALTKVLGGYRHLRLGTVDQALALRLALGSVPGVLAGTALLAWLQGHGEAAVDRFVTRALGVALMLTAVAVCWRAWRPAPPTVRARALAGRLLVPAAFALGALVGVTSVGSGSLFVVLLAFATPLSMERIVGTDVFHAALLTLAGATAHWGTGTVQPEIVVQLLLGSLPGVWVGSTLAARMPRRVLSGAVAALLFATGLRLI